MLSVSSIQLPEKRVEDAELGLLLTASHRLTAHGRGRAIAMEAPFGLAFNYPGQLSWGVPWTASFRTIAAINAILRAISNPRSV